MLLAPLGCHTMTHNKPETRTSWGPRASEGFYISNSMEHFHYFKIWMTDTCIICISDTVQFHHKCITMQRTTNNNDGIKAAKNLTKVLLTMTLIQLNETEKQALQYLHELFTNAVTAKHHHQQLINEPNVNSPHPPTIKPPSKQAPQMRMQP